MLNTTKNIKKLLFSYPMAVAKQRYLRIKLMKGKVAFKPPLTDFTVIYTNKHTPFCPMEVKEIWTAKKMEAIVQVYTGSLKRASKENSFTRFWYPAKYFTLNLREPIKSCHFVHSIPTSKQNWAIKPSIHATKCNSPLYTSIDTVGTYFDKLRTMYIIAIERYVIP